MKRKLLIAAGAGVLLGGAGLGAAYIFSGESSMFDTCFFIGLALIMVGAAAMMKGNPMPSLSSPSMGKNASAEGDIAAKVAFDEIKNTDLKENHILKVNPAGIALLLGGIINFAVSLIPVLAK